MATLTRLPNTAPTRRLPHGARRDGICALPDLMHLGRAEQVNCGVGGGVLMHRRSAPSWAAADPLTEEPVAPKVPAHPGFSEGDPPSPIRRRACGGGRSAHNVRTMQDAHPDHRCGVRAGHMACGMGQGHHHPRPVSFEGPPPTGWRDQTRARACSPFDHARPSP